MALLPPEKAELKTTARSKVWVWRPARGLYVTRVVGHFDDAAAAFVETMARKVVADDGKIAGFHDWEEMTDYDAEARARLMELVRQIRKENEFTQFLVRSRLVALGIQAASVVLHGLRVHHTRAGFEATLHECIRQRSSV